MAGIALNWDPAQFETKKSRWLRVESVGTQPDTDGEEALESLPA